MTTWVLLFLLSYSNGGPETGGSVAMQSERIEFFSEKECYEAKKTVEAAINREGFKRGFVICMKRSGPLMEPEPKLGSKQ